MSFLAEIAFLLLKRPLVALVRYVQAHPVRSLVFVALSVFGWSLVQTVTVAGAVLVRFKLVGEDGNPFYRLGAWLAGHKVQAALGAAALVLVAPVLGASLLFWLAVDSLKAEA